MMAFRHAALHTGALLLCAVAGQAHAAFEYVSQSRSVSASVTGSSDALSASDFAPFDESVSVSDINTSAGASASLDSTLGMFEIAAAGSTSADALQTFLATSSIMFEVVFQIDEPVEYTLDAFAFEDPSGNASFELVGPGGVISSLDALTELEDMRAGTLGIGTYTLTASAISNNPFGDNGSGAFFDFTLTIAPTPPTACLLGVVVLGTRRRRA